MRELFTLNILVYLHVRVYISIYRKGDLVGKIVIFVGNYRDFSSVKNHVQGQNFKYAVLGLVLVFKN